MGRRFDGINREYLDWKVYHMASDVLYGKQATVYRHIQYAL